ncbi:MAG: DUF5057 domain-containing protein [Candidatus Weimeria sp.]
MSDDTFQNSLVYYNIGDEYYVWNNEYVTLNGLLDSDYSETKGTMDTYRYSGNDISVKKQTELESFIKQGFPVIVSDGLVDDTSHDAFDAKIGLNLSEDYDDKSDKYTVSFNPILVDDKNVTVSITDNGKEIVASDLLRYSYSWYKKENGKWEKLSGETGNSYVVPKTAEGSGNDSFLYCCIDSVSDGTTTVRFDNNNPDGGNGPKAFVQVWHNNAGHGVVNSPSYYTSDIYSFPAIHNNCVSKTTVDNNTRLYETLSDNIDRGNVMSYSSAEANGDSVESYASLSSPEIDMEEAPKQYDESDPDGSNICGSDAYDEKGVLDQSKKKLDFKFRIVNQTDLTPADTTYTAKVYADLNSDGVFDSDSEEITSITANKINSDGSTGGEVLPTALYGGITRDSAQMYSLSAQLPESLQGAFTWKLVIYENSDDPDAAIDDCPRDSYKGVSFVGLNNKYQKIRIRVLQINSDSNKGTTAFGNIEWYDLENLMANPNNPDNGKTNWFGKKLTDSTVTNLYDIKIKTIHAEDFNDYSKNFRSKINDQDSDWAKENPKGTWIDYYDMVILGFGDSYKGPDESGLKEIDKFIGRGKAVLFCHDNSSYNNVTEKSNLYDFHTHSNFTNAFYFNTMFRSKAFMDVYGISDSENTVNGYQLGGQAQWNLTKEDGSKIGSGILAQGAYDKIKAAAAAIKNLGYSIAYKPLSGGNIDGTLLSQIQGFSDTATAHRYKTDSTGVMWKDKDENSNIRDNGKKGALISKTVSQVNKGQITSYPYDINVGEFNTSSEKSAKNGFIYTGAKAVMPVNWTHAQWYQLNTNADNIVVWYTVENDKDINQDETHDLYGYNDCINNYYIYNCGNITYTGSGHADSSWETTEEEAKLFVNTMIAAFRTSTEKPSAAFYSDEKGTKTTSQMNIEAETGSNNSTGTSESTDKSTDTTAVINAISSSKIYFKITDNTISKNKTNGIYLYNSAKATTDKKGVTTYTVSDDQKIDISSLKLYDTKGKECKSDNLKSGKVYYFYLPSNSKAYDDLVHNNKDSSEIWLVPYNKGGDGDPVKLTISLTKTGLFDLG